MRARLSSGFRERIKRIGRDATRHSIVPTGAQDEIAAIMIIVAIIVGAKHTAPKNGLWDDRSCRMLRPLSEIWSIGRSSPFPRNIIPWMVSRSPRGCAPTIDSSSLGQPKHVFQRVSRSNRRFEPAERRTKQEGRDRRQTDHCGYGWAAGANWRFVRGRAQGDRGKAAHWRFTPAPPRPIHPPSASQNTFSNVFPVATAGLNRRRGGRSGGGPIPATRGGQDQNGMCKNF